MFTEDMLDHNMKYNHTPPPITTYSLQHYYALRYIERGIAFVWMGYYDQCKSNVLVLVKTFLVQVLYNFLSRSLGVMGIMLRKTNVVLSN